MEEQWHALLSRLSLNRGDLQGVIKLACQDQPRFRQSGITDDEIEGVYRKVVPRLVRTLTDEPSLPVFHDREQFLAYFRRSAVRSLGEQWTELLSQLRLTHEELLTLVGGACRKQPRFRQKGVSRDLIDSVYAGVFLALAKILEREPRHPIFHDREQFRRYVWTTALRADDPDARRNRRPSGAREVFCSPSDLVNVEGRAVSNVRDLNCPHLCVTLLAGAESEHRELFLVMCESLRQTGDIPTYEVLAARLNTSRATVCRRWKVVSANIQRLTGDDRTDLPDWE